MVDQLPELLNQNDHHDRQVIHTQRILHPLLPTVGLANDWQIWSAGTLARSRAVFGLRRTCRHRLDKIACAISTSA